MEEREVQVRDYRELFQQFFEDGFTAECLSAATGISQEKILRLSGEEALGAGDQNMMRSMMYVLMEMYGYDFRKKEYLESIADSLNRFYKVPISAIMRYLGLDEEQYRQFINEPEKYEDGLFLAMKLMSLFTTFVREKPKSC